MKNKKKKSNLTTVKEDIPSQDDEKKTDEFKKKADLFKEALIYLKAKESVKKLKQNKS